MLNTVLGCAVAAPAALLFGGGFAALLASTFGGVDARGGGTRVPRQLAARARYRANPERGGDPRARGEREFELIALRAGEVLAGSGMALLMAWVYARLHRSAAATNTARFAPRNASRRKSR